MTNMTRREATAGLLAGSAVAMASPARAQPGPDRPNILILVADDLGFEDTSLYGARNVATPQLERLAAGGLTADTAVLTTSSCSPSRISMLTGLFPHQTATEDMHIPLPGHFTILPSYLREAGYFSGHMGKTHYGPRAEAQFDWYSDDFSAFETFLSARGDQPFFMWVGFNDPHRPYGEDDAKSDPNLAGAAIDDGDVPMDQRRHLRERDRTRAELAAYYREVRRMDGNIGWFMDRLAAAGLEDNTLVVFLTDNGAPFPREKASLYDAGIRTPFVVRWPQHAPQGERRSGLFSTIDLAPTILSAAGLPAPSLMEGRDQLPALRGGAPFVNDAVFAVRNWHGTDGHQRAIRTGEYKLILNAYVALPHGNPSDITGSGMWKDLLEGDEAGALTREQGLNFAAPRAKVELYHLPTDPHEYTNVAWREEHFDTAKVLARQLADWRARTGDFPSTRRIRADTSDRRTGVLFQPGVPPLENP